MLIGQFPPIYMLGVRAPAVWRRRVRFLFVCCGLLILGACTSGGPRAPVVDLSSGQSMSALAPADDTYLVRPGDTLNKIAQLNRIDIENLKRLNNLTDPDQITVGRVLKLTDKPSGTSESIQVTPIANEAPALPQPLEQTPSATADNAVSAKAATPTRAADADVIHWGWPAKGKIIQEFNTSTKGIDISGVLGDPVVAAADGKVMYSGNGVRGLGNLIIINHQNGFITAYAHNRVLLIKTGEKVRRGDKIAEVGQSDATLPRLHFEIRRHGTPIDPLQYLPPR